MSAIGERVCRQASLISQPTHRVTMYIAYIDESGSYGSMKVFAVAGWAAHALEWARLEFSWKRALAEFGLSSFHMAECENRRGLFAQWSKADTIEAVKRFASIIEGRYLNGFGMAVLLDDFYELPKEDRVKWFDNHYLLCFQSCVLEISKRADRLPKHEWTAFVAERQEEFNGQTQVMYQKIVDRPKWPNRDRLGSLSFGSGTESIPLQAADMIAYETFKQVHNMNFDPRPVRKSFERMMNKPFIGGY